MLAAAGLVLDRSGVDLPPGAVARVNQRLILRDAWLRAVAAVASDRRGQLTAEDKRRILDRLIDEELLVQHGIALGLVERDARIRSELVSQVMLAATSVAATEAADSDLRKFYLDNQSFFTPPARLRIAAWHLDADGARRAFQPPVPNALLPASTLQNYLGPALTVKALTLKPGDRFESVDSDKGRSLIELLERQAGPPPAFDQIRDQVRAEWNRRADEAAVRALLLQLRDRERIVVAPDLQ